MRASQADRHSACLGGMEMIVCTAPPIPTVVWAGGADSPAAVSAGVEGLDQSPPSPSPRPAFGREASAGVIQARCVLIGNGPAFTSASGRRRLGPPLSVSARSKENLGFNTRTLALRR